MTKLPRDVVFKSKADMRGGRPRQRKILPQKIAQPFERKKVPLDKKKKGGVGKGIYNPSSVMYVFGKEGVAPTVMGSMPWIL